MRVKIDNCNNIVHGEFEVQNDKLNIKYGVNGTGKSTLSKAMVYKINSEDKLASLKPFNSDTITNPSVDIDETINKVMIYNEEYVSSYLFVENGNNLIHNSFEVFVKPDNYDEKINSINQILATIKDYVNSNELLNKIISSKNEILALIKFNGNRTRLSTTAPLYRALKEGNKLLDIPENVTEFSAFMNNSEMNLKWIKWFTDGQEYATNGICPFCTKQLNEEFQSKVQTIRQVFDKKNVETLTKTSSIIGEISYLFNEDSKCFLNQLTTNTEEVSEEDKEKFTLMYLELESICSIFENIKGIDFFNLNRVNDLADLLNQLKIETRSLSYINSNNMVELINEFNTKTDDLITNLQPLQIEINILNSNMNRTVSNNLKQINDFLETTDMKYYVRIDNERKIVLCPKDSIELINPIEHLSWGERNSFALALFTFEALFLKPELIILDDPVSSFDTNKKYAIFHFLFKRDRAKCLKGKTVLMLTHDLEPIINLYKLDKISPDLAIANYIENNRGILSEKEILCDNIDSIINVSKNCILNEEIHIINRLIHMRRYYELNDKYDTEYNLLSCLFKGVTTPTYKDTTIQMSEVEISNATEEIKLAIPEFDYNQVCGIINDEEDMKDIYLNSETDYEKIQIFRIMNDRFNLSRVDKAIDKFINESFHIENSYIFQLNPYAYNIVPNYIMDVCNSIIGSIGGDGDNTVAEELATTAA